MSGPRVAGPLHIDDAVDIPEIRRAWNAAHLWMVWAFFVRLPAALFVPAMMMLIVAIWVRCGHALAGFGPPFDAAMLSEYVGGPFSGVTVLLTSCFGSRDGGQRF